MRKTIARPDTSNPKSDGQPSSEADSQTTDPGHSMEVIRDLLFGHEQKSNDARLTALSCELDRLEALILAKSEQHDEDLKALEKRFMQAKQRDLNDMGEAILAIGHSIKRLGVTS